MNDDINDTYKFNVTVLPTIPIVLDHNESGIVHGTINSAVNIYDGSALEVYMIGLDNTYKEGDNIHIDGCIDFVIHSSSTILVISILKDELNT